MVFNPFSFIFNFFLFLTFLASFFISFFSGFMKMRKWIWMRNNFLRGGCRLPPSSAVFRVELKAKKKGGRVDVCSFTSLFWVASQPPPSPSPSASVCLHRLLLRSSTKFIFFIHSHFFLLLFLTQFTHYCFLPVNNSGCRHECRKLAIDHSPPSPGAAGVLLF